MKKPVFPGGEPANDPIWKDRAEKLHKLLTGPMPPTEIYRKAKLVLGWASHVTTNTLSTMENRSIYFRDGRWYPFGFRYQPEQDVPDETSPEQDPLLTQDPEPLQEGQSSVY